MFQAPDFSFIHKYFLAEKQAGLYFLIIGSTAIVLAIVAFFFIKINPPFFKGLAVPLLVVGLIQAVVGFTIYKRSDAQRMEVAYQMGIGKNAYVREKELPRMETVLQRFTLYRYTEMALAIAGLFLFVFFFRKEHMLFWKGLGVGLMLQALVCLVADSFAEKRSERYTMVLREKLQPSR